MIPCLPTSSTPRQPGVGEVPGGLRDRLSAEMEEGAGHWRWVIKERGEGRGGECVWVCDSHRDKDGDECLSAFR